MRYIACEGQVNMARIGYSPLPPNLSQEVVNSVARMQGSSPEILSADNCANPTFRGSLGAGAESPTDPLAGQTDLSGNGAGPASQGGTQGGGATDAAAGTADAGPGSKRDPGLVEGGSTEYRALSPSVYNRGKSSDLPVLPVIVFFAVLAVPAIAVSIARATKRGSPPAGTPPA
jgi:phosphate transport system substrate-binding protein